MDTIRVEAKSSGYNVLVGTNVSDAIFEVAGDRKIYVVTDSEVLSLYGEHLHDILPQAKIFSFKRGEKSKNQKTLFDILEFLMDKKASRSSLVVAFGGGVVGDITGLASSLYMRGVDVLMVPTTLLSQVDSSVGGKTAINLGGIKNIVGTFKQPIGVVCDIAYLSTLGKDDIISGVGEIVKTAGLDAELYDYTCENLDKIFKLDSAVMEEVIAMCIRIKAEIVAEDEQEKTGQRKKLNLGHTIGHAFESAGIFGSKSHGECVLCGMFVETMIAKKLGKAEETYADELIALAGRALGYVPQISDVEKMVETATMDKKNNADNISIILPTKKGEAVEVYLSVFELEKMLEEIKSELKEMEGDK